MTRGSLPYFPCKVRSNRGLAAYPAFFGRVKVPVERVLAALRKGRKLTQRLKPRGVSYVLRHD